MKIDNLESFLNSIESEIRGFKALHIGFFESDSGITFYATGSAHAPNNLIGTELSSINSTESFPLDEERYWSTHDFDQWIKKPFEFSAYIKKNLLLDLKDGKLSSPYTDARVITTGWDDGDLEVVKFNDQ